MVFLNRGDRFEARPLRRAQFAPPSAFPLGTRTAMGTRRFLNQNFFATQPSTSPYDAGRGLWLKGDGKGGLASVPGQAV